jgi:hypothetical protein
MSQLRGRSDVTLFGAGIVLFLAAIVVGGTLLYGLADFCFAGGFVALLQAEPVHAARSPQLYRGGAILGALCAGIDGVLTLATATGSVTDVLTVGIFLGFVAIVAGAWRA